MEAIISVMSTIAYSLVGATAYLAFRILKENRDIFRSKRLANATIFARDPIFARFTTSMLDIALAEKISSDKMLQDKLRDLIEKIEEMQPAPQTINNPRVFFSATKEDKIVLQELKEFSANEAYNVALFTKKQLGDFRTNKTALAEVI